MLLLDLRSLEARVDLNVSSRLAMGYGMVGVLLVVVEYASCSFQASGWVNRSAYPST